MISLLLFLGGPPNFVAPPVLFDCQVNDVDGEMRRLAILFRGPTSADYEMHDPSYLLGRSGGAVRVTNYWPSYWELDTSPYFARGPHGENLGTKGGWTVRIESRPNSNAEATIMIKNFDELRASGDRPAEPDFTVIGDCNWSKGRAARAAYRKLAK